MKTTYCRKRLAAILTILGAAFGASAQQTADSPLVVQKTLTPSEFGVETSPLPQLKLELRVGNPAVVAGDLTIGLFQAGSAQQGIFQLNSNVPVGAWTWQNSVDGGTPHIHMDLTAAGTLRLFGNGTDSIVLRSTAGDVTSGETPGVFVNGSRLVTMGDLANDLVPRIQSVTMKVDSALSVGNVNGIIGAGSMAAGTGASVYGSGSLAFGEGAHVGTALMPDGTVEIELDSEGYPVGQWMANNAVALGKDARALGEGAMAFGENASATGEGGMALGKRAFAGRNQAIAIGQDSSAYGGTYIAGPEASYEWGTIAVGTRASAQGIASTAFGTYAKAEGHESIALGPKSLTSNGATGAVALGASAHATRSGSIAVGINARSNSIGGMSIGSMSFTNGSYAAAIGSYIESPGAGMIAVGTAPNFTGLTANANWDDMNSVVFIVGGGKSGNLISGSPDFLSNWNMTRRTSLSVTRGGDVKAAGKIEASKAGGINVPDTIEAKNGTTQIKGLILIERQGDISMGAFTDSPAVPQ